MSYMTKKRAWQVPALALVVLVPLQEGQWTQAELESESAAIQRDVASLRGAEFKRPVAVKLAGKKEFLDYALARAAKSDPPERIAADETIAKMLGLIPVDMDVLKAQLELLEGQVGGFYDPDGEAFYLMEGFEGGIARVILSHELGHALDDQLFDLDGGIEQRAGNTDATLAYHAVVEGSGTAVMTRWVLAHPKSLDLTGLTKMQAEQNAALNKAPMVLWKPLLASYLCGAAFLARSDKIMVGQSKPAENADIDAAFRSPPASTEQVLHPEKYWDAEQRDEPRDASHASGDLPRGWEVLRRDRLGELMLAILATAPADRTADLSNPFAVIATPFTNDVVTGWGGDEVLLLGETGGKSRYLSLRTLWDTPRDAAEFYGAMSLLLPGLKARAEELGQRGSVELAYGAEDEVWLEVYCGSSRSDARRLRTGLGRSSD